MKNPFDRPKITSEASRSIIDFPSEAQRQQFNNPDFRNSVEALGMELIFPNPTRPLPENVKDVLFSGNAYAIDMATRSAEDVLAAMKAVDQAVQDVGNLFI